MANGNYGRIMNNFMGELPSPLGNTVSMTDLALAVLRHICLIACVWLTHSLWHIWMFHSVNYMELVRGENRFVQGLVCSACMRICVHIVKICLQVYLYYSMCIGLQHVQVRYSMCAVSKCRYVYVLYVCIFHNGNLDSEACSTVFSQVWIHYY